MRNPDIDRSVRERFDDYLRRNHKRRTAERFAILEKVQAIPGHFTADSLGDMLRREDFPVSAATVYATLELLVDFGLLMRQRFANQGSLYEKSPVGSGTTHHHLICTSCGKIKEVRDPGISRQIEERRFSGFSQNYYTLNIYGTCTACSRKKKKVQSNKVKKQ